LEQYPLLSQPAYREQSAAASAPTEAPAADEEAPKEEPKEEVEEKGSKKKGGKGKGGGGGKKGGKGKDKKEAKDDDEEEGAKEEGEVLLIDDLWPKKEALGLTKWSVTRSVWSSSRATLGCSHTWSTISQKWNCTEHGLTCSHDRISIYTINSVPLFFNHFDGPFIPTLKLLHQCQSPSFQSGTTSIDTRSRVAPACADRPRSDQVLASGEMTWINSSVSRLTT
jgi:PUA domain protein